MTLKRKVALGRSLSRWSALAALGWLFLTAAFGFGSRPRLLLFAAVLVLLQAFMIGAIWWAGRALQELDLLGFLKERAGRTAADELIARAASVGRSLGRRASPAGLENDAAERLADLERRGLVRRESGAFVLTPAGESECA